MITGRTRSGLLLAILLSCAACDQPAVANERTVLAPAATRAAVERGGLKTAIFAGGCFWGIEGVFSHVKGVTSVVSGYHGGSAATAQYERTNRGDTGHAEAVRVTYDPAVVRYDQLLQIFFSVATDPTQLNRQGPDVGSQYRNALVPLGGEQYAVAIAYLAQLRAARVWGGPIVTRVEAHRQFFPAETYHQDFMDKNPNHGYIVHWDRPKVQALRQRFPEHYKPRFTPG